MFQLEAKSLQALASGPLRVPQVITVGSFADVDCLVLEYISSTSQAPDFFEQLGSGLAELHRLSSDCFGWAEDNYLGTTRQPNHESDDWLEFFSDQRLEFQFQLARRNGLGSRELFKLGEKLCQQLNRFIGQPEDPPSLLHGDLWSGNFLADETGVPVIFDPAIYYGRREADLAMPALFGGFPSSFWDSYHEAWPLAEGWQERLEIYKLYHLLNHLNLFGSGYLDDCLEILRRFT